ncbi:tricarboxylate transporter [Arsenicitalea aurantiaca]|uniref:Tricarboxylate transporter n=1 Tax=Arsenicitalea aurantiaca TaxID=1783274 RepID=A0A433X488_9HYPH|nr:tripartite tricarboxylate transporter permease [Arsenicitalea aurantiaca]RUT28861.1 tricarboxylate transporter [Arsenicitalea aurantiaca]
MLETLQALISGFGTALLPNNLLAALIGSVLGIVIGAIPGLGSVTAIALLLPLTFGLDPTTAIIMLAAVYFGCMFGGAYSAILLNIPGDAPAVMTAMDGYPMSRDGRGGKALFAANYASFIGGTIGIVILTFTGPLLADFGLRFGPAETGLLILVALTSIGWLLGTNVLKGLAATAVGIMLATIGIGTTFGQPRFTLDSIYLLNGINFIPLVIGMFGFAQLLEMMAARTTQPVARPQLGLRDSLPGAGDLRALLPVSVRSGFLGTLTGVVPGAGATTGSFFAYILERRVGRNREQMGKGAAEGVAAAESGNNSAAVGSFAPLLSLGIPGSGTSAILLGGLMMWGLQPGPLLFQNQPDFVWGLISSMYIGNVMAVIAAFLIIPFLMRILWVPTGILVPIVGVVCIVAAYSVSGSMFEVWMMIGVGVVAYLMGRAGYPAAPLLLAFVLTPRLETSIRQAFDISNGSLGIFVSSPIAIALLGVLVLILLALVWPLLSKRKPAENPL